ncbi:MAG: ABC transporter permease, partial [Frankiales bacterium]|nr:ABC transporter permease [Frankiales bacterium]
QFGGLASFLAGAYTDPKWLVTFAGHHVEDLHAALAAHGIIYETRQQWEFPPPELGATAGRINSQVVAVLGSIVLFGIAEIVLLAGTAFAVGTRRQVQQLGLLRAVGGDETEVRRVVLAQGLLLGAVGAVLGVVLGVATVFFSRPVLEQVSDTAFGRLDGRPAQILAVALVGVVAGLLAAVVPARTSARMSVLDMLRSRFQVDAGVVRVPAWAWGALIVGPIVVVLSAYGWHHALGGGGAAGGSASIGDLARVFTSSSSDGRWTVAISLGAAIALAGILRSCPALLTRLGRLAHRFPLSLRLATRDAARHRHRTAPAAAAVATVVAGAVLVLFVASSTDIRGRETYQPTTPVGTGWLTTGPRMSMDQALALVRKQIGIRTVGTYTNLTAPSNSQFSRLGARFVGCPPQADCLDESVAIGTPALVDIVAGRHVPGAAQVLASGGAVVLSSGLAHAGHVQIDRAYGRHHLHYASTSLAALDVAHVPAYAETPHVVVSAQTAAAQGWRTLGNSAILVPAHLPNDAEFQRVQASLGQEAALGFEHGYQGRLGLVLLALIGAAAIATLAGTSIAVALAMAESRADMATLAAVGASPSRRRVHAMAQAFTVGGLGSVLGLGLGSLVGIALLQGSTSYPFTVPFRWLALLIVSAPVLSVLVAGAVTRGRVDLTRRIA